MKLLRLENVKEGSVLGKVIVAGDGKILLKNGVKLSERLIQKIRDENVTYICIEDPRTEDIEIRDMISEETRLEGVKAISKALNSCGKNISCKDEISLCVKIVRDMVEEIMKNKDETLSLVSIGTAEGYLPHHCVNVALYSVVIGMAWGFEKDDLEKIGIGGLFHDIGKSKVPKEILNKPGKLSESEMEIIRKHSRDGFDILKSYSNVPLLSSHVALQHHEKFDGGGYPQKKKGEDIHIFSRICAIADVYDALVSNRVYKKGIPSSEAYEFIMGNASTHFDFDLVSAFTKLIAIYPIGSVVVLNTGESGIVIRNNKQLPNRPVVRKLTDSFGNDIAEPTEMDLAIPDYNSITIDRVL